MNQANRRTVGFWSDPIPLWRNSVNQRPRLRVLPHDDAARPCVLVLPGGGYGHLADHEAEPVAERFGEAGFHAAVLRYRIKPDNVTHPAMINDVQRAIRMLRSGTNVGGMKVNKIAVLGFSAGGHLAATSVVHYDRFTSPDDDLAEKVSARPDAGVLCYPVMDLLGAAAHGGSRKNLLGDKVDDAELCQLLSPQLHVNEKTPPCYLWHTAEDKGVVPINSWMFAQACVDAGVPVECHVYEEGRHGIGLATDTSASSWPDLAAAFLKRHFSH